MSRYYKQGCINVNLKVFPKRLFGARVRVGHTAKTYPTKVTQFKEQAYHELSRNMR